MYINFNMPIFFAKIFNQEQSVCDVFFLCDFGVRFVRWCVICVACGEQKKTNITH